MGKKNRTVIIAVTLNNNHQLYLVINDKDSFGFTKNILKATKLFEIEARKILDSLRSLGSKELKYKLIDSRFING